MGFELIAEKLNGLKLIKPQVFGDDRGFFMESWKRSDFLEIGIDAEFVQDNHSKSAKNVFRGLHFQWNDVMGKLLRVVSGSCKFYELDIRRNSPTLGNVEIYEISADNKHLLWVPPGFANGFLTLEDDTEVMYKCTSEWNPKCESGIYVNDPELKIGLNLEELIMSDKDKKAQSLNEWLAREESNYFNY